jgi:hypothetical protein
MRGYQIFVIGLCGLVVSSLAQQQLHGADVINSFIDDISDEIVGSTDLETDTRFAADDLTEYPGVNSKEALKVRWYTAFSSGRQMIRHGKWSEKGYNIGYDAQAVHGLETKNGQLVSVGHSWECEDTSKCPRNAFIVATNPDGSMAWFYNSNITGADEGVVAVAEMHNGDILAAGFYQAKWHKSLYKNWLIRVKPAPPPALVCSDTEDAKIVALSGGALAGCAHAKEAGLCSHPRLVKHCPVACNKCPEGSVRHSKDVGNPIGTLVWAAAFEPRVAGRHATFESIAMDQWGGVLLGGVENNKEGKEFKYKSAGNVPQGTAFAWGIPKKRLMRSAAPRTKDTTFKWGNRRWTSVKAIRPVGNTGKAIALVHREVIEGVRAGAMEAGLVLLKRNGKPQWGPYLYKKQTEGTDLAVAPDGSGFVLTGHGSTAPKGAPAEYKGRLTRVSANGKRLWTKVIAFAPKLTEVIFNECWGVQPIGGPKAFKKGRGKWILSCGTGIENMETCNDPKIRPDRRKKCKAGYPSAFGGVPRMPSVWANMVPSFSDSKKKGKPGKLLWSRVTSFSKTGSSAAEFISPCKKGGFYVTTDEVFGAGFLRLGGPKQEF